ncbi:MAG: hypothetical protein ACYTEQ_00865 [Planctomycetota bacterium]|jgi:hypothetical protein
MTVPETTTPVEHLVNNIVVAAPCPPMDELGLECLVDKEPLKKNGACRRCWIASVKKAVWKEEAE